MLAKFFAVTKTSLYEVLARGENHYPCARKIAMHRESMIAVSSILSNQMLAIAKWLQFFIPEGHGWMSPLTSVERRLENVSTQWWWPKTSEIVALFLEESDAQECFSTPNLQPCDPHWLEKTREVVESVEEDHPTIVVCRFPSLDLLAED